MSNIAIITGVSRGLGESLATLLLESGTDVLGISRTPNKKLATIAEDHNQFYQHFPCDLSNTLELEQCLDSIHEIVFTLEKEKKIEMIYIINNAGVAQPINQAKHVQSKDLVSHMAVNTIAPMVITNQFLLQQPEHEIPLVIANVSSGAAETPVYGWSAYCSSKAGINMYTKTVALELNELESNNKIIAFSPGIMDTAMQGEIRSTEKEEFIRVEQFKEFKTINALRQTDIVAGVLIDIITDEDVKNGKLYDIKNYL